MAEVKVVGLTEKNRVEPEDALEAGFRIEQLPEGLKFYINQQAFDLGRTRVIVNLYKMVSVEGGRKLRRSHVERFVNEFPEEEYIALKYGPHPEGYIWIAKWTPVGKEERSMASPEIYIDESWRGRYEEAQRKARGEADPAVRSVPAAPAPTAQVGSPVPTFAEMIALMHAAEDRAYNNLARIMETMKRVQPESPTLVLEKGVEAVGRMIEKTVEMQMGAVKKLQRKADDAMDRALEDEEEIDEGTETGASAGGSGLPIWLEPFIEKGKEYLSDLIEGGPGGAMIKKIIVSSEQFKEIFGDKDKWEVAVRAMREHFGEDKAEKAIAILLGKTTGKKAAK